MAVSNREWGLSKMTSSFQNHYYLAHSDFLIQAVGWRLLWKWILRQALHKS